MNRLKSHNTDPWPVRAYGFAMQAVEPFFSALQRRIGIKGMAYVFVAPNLIFFGLFVALPMALNIWYALSGSNRLLIQERPFVGLDNFRALLDCASFVDANSCKQDRFWRAVHNSILFVSLQVGAMVLLSVVAALLLNGKIKGRGFFRAVFFFPVLLSPVVVALIWKWVLQPDGLLNALIVWTGGERIAFLHNASWSFFWTVFVSVWSHMGFYTLILLAGLQAIPHELYEAAEIDGTSARRTFWRVTMPLLLPALLVVLILSLIRGVQAFEEVFILTGGGPGTATQYIVQYIYETAFANQVHLLGLAAAASLLVAFVLMLLTLMQLRISYHGKDK
jgi:alpha-1,4-digalacturonate transport system permease protein